MASLLPITLSGVNLGERHRHLNLQVNQLVAAKVSFQDVEALPEQTTIDRLFKIDTANKLHNVDYILKTLKDDDVLYVSRALKCKWLLERGDIINPKYLEDSLFPEMVIPAISKMKHWLYINLHDAIRCQEFYQYYKGKKLDFAIKFLIHCDDEFVLKEFPKLLIKINPHYLKVFAEKNPKLVKFYFDSLETHNELVKNYLRNEKIFYNNIKCILKFDPDLYLDIVEKYHNYNKFPKLSPSATDYILRYHKHRFMAKSELYTVHLLHMPTVARKLSVEECQEIVICLARADYLKQWFSYENVELLIKRIGRDNRAAFKKRIFVEKDVGELIMKCPYKFPASPIINDINTEPHVFHDCDYSPVTLTPSYRYREKMLCCQRMGYMADFCPIPVKSELQQLFDEFRVVGFVGTFQELKGRINATSSADRRRDMLLVLVSKSGGHVESVRELMQLALKMRNEPVHQRASVVRSLVKRAKAWRFPDDVWDMILEYGSGLGLDGSDPEAQCREGLHAVVLRQLLTTGDCEPAVRTAFLNDFSSLSNYKFTSIERQKVCVTLQQLLMSSASNAEPILAANYLSWVLQVLDDYHVNPRSTSIVSAVTHLAKRDPDSARPLLKHLYQARVGRRELLHQYLEFKHDDAALVNILRHDLQALKCDWLIQLLMGSNDYKTTRANQFLLKLSIYFNEKGGIAEKLKVAIQDKITTEPSIKLARPLATLASGGELWLILSEKHKRDSKHFKFSAALLANMHCSRSALDPLVLGWRKVGLKAFGGRALRCRQSQSVTIAQTLLKEGSKRTIRLALAIAQRTDCVADIFAAAVTIRPLAALRAAVLYLRSNGEAADLKIWDIVKPFLTEIDHRPREGFLHIITNIKWVPKALQPNYCADLYITLDRISDSRALEVLQNLLKYLPEVNDDLLEKVLLRMLENLNKKEPDSYPAIIVRYLMLSKNVQDGNTRWERIGDPFFIRIYEFRERNDELITRRFFQNNFNQILQSLLYNFVFFDIKYQNCLTVMERVLKWMQTFLPKDTYFVHYVKVHATMLYFKAIRQSMKQKPEVFNDVARKMSEGVDVVGFTFGRYISREVVELKSKYFDSVVEIYSRAFQEYLNKHINYSCSSGSQFIAAIIKGMLTESVGTEARLGVHVLTANRYILEDNIYQEIKEMVMKKEDVATHFILYADIAP